MKEVNLEVSVEESKAQLRLDKFLSELPQIQSRSRAEHLIDMGLILVNQKPQKASYKVRTNDQVTITIPAENPTELQPLKLDLEIFFEDDDLLVVNKPVGLVVHPAAGHEQDTLVNALVNHVKNFSMKFGEKRPGIVHRLDKETSGLLVVAKNDFTHEKLTQQFKDRTIERIYHATCYGELPWNEGSIESYLARHPHHRKKFASIPGTYKTSFFRQNKFSSALEKKTTLVSDESPKGKWAKTHFKKIKVENGLTYLEVRLETGRTHQIRVHFFELGFPLAGDLIYYNKNSQKALENLGLKAITLAFVHPRTLERMKFSL